MERLEAALAKAREMRQSALGVKPADGGSGGAVAAGAVDTLWTSLPEFQVDDERAHKFRISALKAGKDAGPYDMLRSRTLRAMKEKGWRRLAITSPDPGCGKTTISMNLAFSLARQKDLRIMLADLDLRRPSLLKALGGSVRASFWEVLERRADLSDCSMRHGENLLVAMNTSPAPHPAELLQSPQTIAVLSEIEAQWRPDILIFDMSPLLASDDNLGFLGNCDSALLIAASESTTMSNIDLCEKELASLTNVLGIVLNKCRYQDESIGYNYGHY